jgi:hypothetical protein
MTLPFDITWRSLLLRMFLGWCIGLIIILIFIFDVNEPHPDWGDQWFVKPVLLTPAVTGFGILSFYLIRIVHPTTNVGRALTYLLSSLLFLVSIWLGIVIGLNGTLWN